MTVVVLMVVVKVMMKVMLMVVMMVMTKVTTDNNGAFCSVQSVIYAQFHLSFTTNQ